MIKNEEDLEVWLGNKNAEILEPVLDLTAEKLLSELNGYRTVTDSGIHYKNIPEELDRKIIYFLNHYTKKGAIEWELS